MADYINEVLTEARASYTAAEAETQLDKAELNFDRLSRQWDDVDAEYHFALRKAGMQVKKVDPALLKRRAAIWYERGRAAYRVEAAEFVAGLRSVEPRHPDRGGVSPFHTQPFPVQR